MRNVILLIIAICVHMAVCLSLHYHFLNPLFYISTHAKGQGGAFFGIYQAGVNLMNGDSIYANDNYRMPKEVAVPFYHFYRYLPFPSYVSSLVTRVLKPWPAYWIWVLINEILLATCILLTLRLRHRYGPAAIAASAFWLLYSPLYIELYMGQFCFTMSFFIFIVLYPFLKKEVHQGAIETGPVTENANRYAGKIPFRSATRMDNSPECDNPVRAGYKNRTNPIVSAPPAKNKPLLNGKARRWFPPISWILSILLKSFTALYTLTLIRIGKKKLAITGLAAAVLTSVPYFLKQPQDLRWFLGLNFQPLPSHSVGGCFGFSSLLRDICDRCLPFVNTGRIKMGIFDIANRNIPLMAVLAAIFILTLFLTFRKRRIDPLANISLWTLTFFLIFKDVWEYHFVMLLPIFVGFYIKTRSRYLLALFILLAVPTPFIFYDIPTTDNPQLYWSAPLSLMHHSFKALPTLLFYIWIVKQELRDTPGIRSIFAFGKSGREAESA